MSSKTYDQTTRQGNDSPSDGGKGDVAKTIKEQVRERYGEIADFYNQPAKVAPQKAAGCCGPAVVQSPQNRSSCCAPGKATQTTPVAQILYDQTDLAGLPDTATLASLGCGNPTAIAGLKPGEVVLDLGSGGGMDCFLAAKMVGPAGRVIGVDMTDSMLELAQNNKAKMGLTNVEFRKGEIEALPVESDTVDVIISNCVINLSPDKEAVFREAFRVLKPGGRLAVSDIVTEGEWSEQFKANVAAWAGCVAGAIDQDEYLEKVRAAGFVDVAVESRASLGIESLDLLDEINREALIKNVDLSAIPTDVRIYSARIVARKPER